MSRFLQADGEGRDGKLEKTHVAINETAKLIVTANKMYIEMAAGEKKIKAKAFKQNI